MDDPRLFHRQAWDLIPWVVNGSADAAERQLVEAHLAACGDCRDEFEFQRQVAAGIAAGGAQSEVADDADAGLARLWARLDAADAVAPSAAPQPGRWTRWLAAAVVVQAVGLAALGGVLWERPRAADYTTLSRTAAAPGPATIRLVPAPSLAVAELQALLLRHRLRIVESGADGGSLGLATAASASLGPADDVLARLRAEPGVLLAEPIGAR